MSLEEMWHRTDQSYFVRPPKGAHCSTFPPQNRTIRLPFPNGWRAHGLSSGKKKEHKDKRLPRELGGGSKSSVCPSKPTQRENKLFGAMVGNKKLVFNFWTSLVTLKHCDLKQTSVCNLVVRAAPLQNEIAGEFQVTLCGVTVCPFSRHKGNQRPKCLWNKAQMHLSRKCPFSTKANLQLPRIAPKSSEFQNENCTACFKTFKFFSCQNYSQALYQKLSPAISSTVSC